MPTSYYQHSYLPSGPESIATSESRPCYHEPLKNQFRQNPLCHKWSAGEIRGGGLQSQLLCILGLGHSHKNDSMERTLLVVGALLVISTFEVTLAREVAQDPLMHYATDTEVVIRKDDGSYK